MANITIKTLADELGVSKQAIRKHIDKLPPTLSVTREGNIIYMNTAVASFIRSKVGRVGGNVTSNVGGNVTNRKNTVKSTIVDNNTPLSSEIEKIINEQLKIKDKQLSEKDKQIQTMQKLLDQQQQLSLQSNKQIEQLQLQLSNETEIDLENSNRNKVVNEKDSNEANEKKGFFNRIFKK